MTYKSGMKIKIKVEPTLANPEDALNDMVDDGMSVHDALNNIITESIVESKVNELLEDNKCEVIKKNGFYFTKYKKSCKMFEFLLEFMGLKNKQDVGLNYPEVNIVKNQIYLEI